MSLGMLGGYGSDSDNTSDENNDHRQRKKSESEVETTFIGRPLESKSKEVTVRQRTPSPTTSYGLSGECDKDVDTNSSPESEVEEEEEEEEKKLTSRSSPLPLPFLDGSDQLASSVFSNPYREAEEAKLDVLRRHVDLSNNVEPPRERRKRTRGHGKRQGLEMGEERSCGDSIWTDGDSPVTITGRGGRQGQKYRSGVSESLQPPKKFMKIHKQICQREQPWTTH